MTFKFSAVVIIALLTLACESKINQQSLELPSNRDKLLIQTYLTENKIEAQEHSSGYFYRILKVGGGLRVKNLDTVEVHYKGQVLYGDLFDDSRNRGSPLRLTVGIRQVIQGWDLALPQMRVGEKSEFYFPSALAYGNVGNGDFIPPNAVLVFEIEVLAIIL